MLLSIITLNYKKPAMTLTCLASVYRQLSGAFEKGEIEFIIVDNNSEDASVGVFKEEINKRKYKNVSVIANNENGGFGTGNNTGAESAKGEMLLFLNNDTSVQDKGLEEMARYMQEQQDIAILGAELKNPDGSNQPSTGKFYTPISVSLFLLGMQRYGLMDRNPHEIAQVDWVKGAIFMIRSDVFKKLGGFDEKIFMYTEDMELCYRAKKTGYHVYFYPGVSVMHTEQGSSNRTFAIVNIYKNLLYFYKKHRSQQEYLYVKTLLKLKALLLIGVGRMSNNSYLTQTYEKALKVA